MIGRLALVLVAAAMVAGCASSVMNGFVGKPLQAAMVQYGPPQNAFDMGDGRRAFQWVMTSTRTAPAMVTNSGSAYPVGNQVQWTQQTQIYGGGPITSSCAYTLYGRWADGPKTWVIESFEKPRLICE